jgi:hypothetical protein
MSHFTNLCSTRNFVRSTAILVLMLVLAGIDLVYAQSSPERGSQYPRDIPPKRTPYVTDIAKMPIPSGIYVLNEASNEQAAATAYASGLTESPAYQKDVTGHAIFVPIAKILPNITTWGEFTWDWGYLDTLVQIALSHGKKFSIELETGFQASGTYLHSLPGGFIAAVGVNSAPLFDVWVTGGSGGRGTSAYVLLPWVQKVQEFWSAAAFALAAHLKNTGAYGSLTLVHVPGLSVYDEEIRLPTGNPRPTTADTLLCPDGRPAYPTVINDADTGRWRSLGYSDTAVINGFKVIASAFAQAFPDRFLGLSLFNPGPKGVDFPNLTGDSAGYVASQIVNEVTAIAPNRVQLQSDNLDADFTQAEVTMFASQYSDSIGWQTNKHAQTGAGCNGGGAGSCDPDSSDGPYFQLLQNGWQKGGEYLEVWSNDVIRYSQAFAAAESVGLYRRRGVTAVSVSNNWNLISVPLVLSNNLRTHIFPTAVSNAFSYEGSYVQKDTLRIGTGYWLKFDGADSVLISGYTLSADSVRVQTGWNLIGSLSDPLPVSLIATVPASMIASGFFGYSGAYVLADTIQPGQAYWVKVDSDGVLILDTSSAGRAKSWTNRIHVIPTSELPPPPPNEKISTPSAIPKQFALDNAYPSPFNPSTRLQYTLPVDSKVRVTVYNLLGQAVAELVNGVETAGYKSVEWNASNFSSGVYFYRLEATSISDAGKSFTRVKKMILIK